MNDTPTAMLYSADALDGFNGNFRVPFLPVNSLYTPWVEQENFRLTKIIPLPREGMKLGLSFEAFNIANNWSPTGLTTQAFTEAKGVLTYTPTAFGVGIGRWRFPRWHAGTPPAGQRAPDVLVPSLVFSRGRCASICPFFLQCRPAPAPEADRRMAGSYNKITPIMKQKIRSTTVICVRRDNKVVMAGDGQVTLGQRGDQGARAKKLRRLYNDKILAGFAGSTADAFALFSRFESKLEQFNGNLSRSVVELAKEWRTDRVLRHLEALLLVADNKQHLPGERQWRRDRARRGHRGHRLRRPVRHRRRPPRCCAIPSFPPSASRKRPWPSPARSASTPTTASRTRSWSSHGDLSSRPVCG